MNEETRAAVAAVESMIGQIVEAGGTRREAASQAMSDVAADVFRQRGGLPRYVVDVVETAITRRMSDSGETRPDAASRTVAEIGAEVLHHSGNPFVWEVRWAIGDGVSRVTGTGSGPDLEPLLHAAVEAARGTVPPDDPRPVGLARDLRELCADWRYAAVGATSRLGTKDGWAEVTITFAP